MLSIAARYFNPFFLEAIIATGVDINFVHDSYHYPTAMHAAISSDRLDNFKLLVEAGGDINFVQDNDRALFERTTKNGSWEFCYYLLTQGIDYRIGEGDITKGNTDGKSDVVWSLKELRCFPQPMVAQIIEKK